MGIKEKTKSDPLTLFHEALNNVRPQIEVRSRRVGGATYQVPVEVRSDRSQALAIRWIINSSRSRSEKSMVDRLGAELIEASSNKGNSVKKGKILIKWQMLIKLSHITDGKVK